MNVVALLLLFLLPSIVSASSLTIDGRTDRVGSRHQAKGPYSEARAAGEPLRGPPDRVIIPSRPTLEMLAAELKKADQLFAEARAVAGPGRTRQWLWHAAVALVEARQSYEEARKTFEHPDLPAGDETLRGQIQRVGPPPPLRGSLSALARSEPGAPPFTRSDRARERSFRQARRTMRYSLAILRDLGHESSRRPTGP